MTSHLSFSTEHEATEWVRFYWHDEAETRDLPRVLLVGDSIVGGHGTALAHRLRGKCGLDYLASSKIVCDVDYMSDLQYMLGRHSYDIIVLNNGLHEISLPDQWFIDALERVMLELRHRVKWLFWRNITPCFTLPGSPENPHIRACEARNALAASLMERLGIPVIDVYSPLRNHPELSSDGVHFHAPGYQIIVDIEADCIEQILSSKGWP